MFTYSVLGRTTRAQVVMLKGRDCCLPAWEISEVGGPDLSPSVTVPGEYHGEWGVLEGRHSVGNGVMVGIGPSSLSGWRDDWLGLHQLSQRKSLPVPLPYFASPRLSQPVGTDPPCYILGSIGWR